MFPPPLPPPGFYQPPNNAFIPVPARQTFSPLSAINPVGYPPASNMYQQPSQPLPPPPPLTPTSYQSPQPEQTGNAWPEPVREYVQRSFDPQYRIPGVLRQDIEAKLTNIISSAADDNRLNFIDWTRLELPQFIIQKERAQMVINPTSLSQSSMSNDHTDDTMTWNSGQSAVTKTRKRKSLEDHASRDDREDRGLPPWRTPNSRATLGDRMSFPTAQPSRNGDAKRTKKDKEDNISRKASKMAKLSLESHQRRFDAFHSPTRAPSPPLSLGPVVGKSKSLEKNYYRLTAAPNPEDVRPPAVLRETLELLKRRWKKDKNYTYIQSQLKAIRQDLTVQHIKNEFTVTVYEIHARIALEKGDLGEFNQCQTQLHGLFAQKIAGHREEFKAYRMLYFIHTCNRAGMNDLLADLTPSDKQHRFIKHALDVRSSLALGNYHRFFQLFLDTPNMGAYLMDMFISRERLAAMACMARAYKPKVKVRFLTEELGFESDAQTIEFLYKYANASLVEEKDGEFYFSIAQAAQLFETAKQAEFKIVDIKGQL
ncbi:MAG: hypothetical protein M1814_004290 [Vezdaea aestivalis]|nr:MAG: hypothetical protein M1814_004290 [Vezdaea aestivalis]